MCLFGDLLLVLDTLPLTCSLFTLVLYEKLSISISKRARHSGKRLLCKVVIFILSRHHVLIFNVCELRAGKSNRNGTHRVGSGQSVHFALFGGRGHFEGSLHRPDQRPGEGTHLEFCEVRFVCFLSNV